MPMFKATFAFASGSPHRDIDYPAPTLLDAAQCADAYLQGWRSAVEMADVRAEKRRALDLRLTRIIQLEDAKEAS